MYGELALPIPRTFRRPVFRLTPHSALTPSGSHGAGVTPGLTPDGLVRSLAEERTGLTAAG